jgi:hypothetical protein
LQKKAETGQNPGGLFTDWYTDDFGYLIDVMFLALDLPSKKGVF